MSFIAAKDYLSQRPTAFLDGNGLGAELDPEQPNVVFSFGSQPLATRNADILEDGKRRKVGVVGAGDVYTKFLLPTFAQRGTELYISDPHHAARAVEQAEQAGRQA